MSQAVELLEHGEFDNMKPTLLYIHGFEENMKSKSIESIANAYLKRADHSKYAFNENIINSIIQSFINFRYCSTRLVRVSAGKLFISSNSKLGEGK